MAMREFVLATGNAGKVGEINQLLEATQAEIQVRAQSEWNVPEADETGLSFVENAILKARNAAEHTGMPAIADDSGIEVDALNGVPGIYSARYAGVGCSDTDNVNKLLAALDGVPEAERTARFQCVIVMLRHAADPTPLICQGSWEGQIAMAPQGENGFGYDPIFIVPEQQCTAAQLPAALKNPISHRGQALIKLVAALKEA